MGWTILLLGGLVKIDSKIVILIYNEPLADQWEMAGPPTKIGRPDFLIGWAEVKQTRIQSQTRHQQKYLLRLCHQLDNQDHES